MRHEFLAIQATITPYWKAIFILLSLTLCL